MMLPELENLAQIAIARILNSLPEGILIAGFAWLVLRLLPRQNSGTRFAIWFVALLALAGAPLIGVFGSAHYSLAYGSAPPLVTLPNHWAVILFSIWLVVACGAAAHLSLGVWRLRALRRTCKVIDPSHLPAALEKLARDFSSSHSVTLATSDKLAVPSAIGFFKPMIVIPEWALRELSTDEFHAILLHEFAHLRRRDDWTNLLQKAMRALFVFHPAVWWIDRQLSLEREMACDDHVLAETGNPRGYAKCLVALLERSFARRAWTLAQAAVRRADEARQRLCRILDRNRNTHRRFGMPALGLAGVFSLLCLVLVPHAPQLVAFAPSASAVHETAVATFANSKFGSVSVIPASMHMSTFARPNEQLPMTAHPSCRGVDMQRPIAAKAKLTPIAPRVVKAKATRPAVREETILVIRTTEQIGPDAWISRFTVWHLTWVPSRTQRVPVAKTT